MNVPRLPADLHGDRLLAWRQVRELAGISRTTAWRLQKAGAFPRPVAISKGRVGWRESEVAAWKAALAPRAERPPAPSRSRPPKVSPAAEPKPRPPLHTARPRRRRVPSAPGQMSFEF